MGIAECCCNVIIERKLSNQFSAMNFPADILFQLEKVLLFPQSELQWVFLGFGGIVLLSLVGKWFSTLFEYRRGFPKLILALFIIVAGGLFGMALGDAYLVPLLDQPWWLMAGPILGFALLQLALAWPLSKFLLGADTIKIFTFSVAVCLVSWGGVSLIAQALQTGSETGSRMQEIEERQRIRTGEDL